MTIKNLVIVPSDNDLVVGLDDQLRLLKSQIKEAFPKIDGPVTATATEINALTTAIAAIDSDVDQIIKEIDAAIVEVNQAANLIGAKTRADFGALAKLPRGLIFPYTGDPLLIGDSFSVANGRHGTIQLDATGTPFTAFIMFKG